MNVNEMHEASLAEIREYLTGTSPDEACAWDLGDDICRQNGWTFKSSVTGIDWAATIKTMDKLYKLAKGDK